MARHVGALAMASDCWYLHGACVQSMARHVGALGMASVPMLNVGILRTSGEHFGLLDITFVT